MYKLRNFIRSILKEEEKKLQRSTDSLALMIKRSSGGDICYALYDANAFVNAFDSAWIDEGEEDTELEKLGIDSMRAMLITGKVSNNDGACYSGRMVKNSASSAPGYGQILYKVALGLEDTLIPDRRTVSQDAINQWAKISAGKRGNAKTQKLDNVKNPKTPQPEDDCKLIAKSPEQEFLDFAYSLDSAPPETQSLVNRHKNIAKEISKKLGVDEKVFELSMEIAADQLFRTASGA